MDSQLGTHAHSKILVGTRQTFKARVFQNTNKKCEEREKNQQDATIICLLLASVSTCFGHHHAHLQAIKDRVTAYGVVLCNTKKM